jgi:lipopolysaccharide export system protein LptA
MLSRLLLSLLLLILPFNSFAFIEGKGSKDPIEITANELLVYKKRNQAIFIGNVKAVQKDTTLFSDKMVVKYKNNNSAKQSEKIEKIDAEGNVKIITPKEIATGKRGTYQADNGIFKLFDEVKLQQEGAELFGDVFIHDTKTGKSDLLSNGSKKPKERAKAIITPK